MAASPLLDWHCSASPKVARQMRPLGEMPKPAPAVGEKVGALSTTLTPTPFLSKALATVSPPIPATATVTTDRQPGIVV